MLYNIYNLPLRKNMDHPLKFQRTTLKIFRLDNLSTLRQNQQIMGTNPRYNHFTLRIYSCRCKNPIKHYIIIYHNFINY